MPAYLSGLLLFWFTCASLAQSSPRPVNWDEIRKRQPLALSLKMEIPKKRYFQGEVIEARLTFINDSGLPHCLWAGTYDRSGRIQDISFHATDEKGAHVSDPLWDYFREPRFGGGVGGFQAIGKWGIPLAANQWVRFDQPGTYRLFATSTRVRGGEPSGNGFPWLLNVDGSIELASDPIVVTIEPLSEATEKKVLEEAGRLLASNDGTQQARGATMLQYLGTPKSLAALLPLLGTPYDSNAFFGFWMARDVAEPLSLILKAVRNGEVKLDDAKDIYVSLKASRMAPFDSTMTPEEQRKRHEERSNIRAKAAEEIAAAAKAAPPEVGSKPR